MRIAPSSFTIAFSTFALSAVAAAQQWVPVATQPRYRAGHGMATDPLTGRPLLFAGSGVYNFLAAQAEDADTWRWNGASWYRLPTALAPAPQQAWLMADDDVRHRIVLVDNSTAPASTWEWDGASWALRNPAASPPSGTQLSASVAFDVARARTVLYDAGALQTWEYDGANWTQVNTAQTPGPRSGFHLAHDFARGRTVLFGGDDGSRRHNVFQDSWEYDGSNWTQIATPVSPPGRSEFALAFDAAQLRVVLYGGRVNQALLNDTWSYDGATWTQLSPASTPPLQVDPQMAPDRPSGHLVLFTGHDLGTGAVPETWEWDGSTWTQRAVPASPPVRELHGLVDDAHGQMLLFGGFNSAFSGLGGQVFADTWRFDGARWQLQSPLSAPSARGLFQIATDTARQRVVLFGGEGNNQWVGDTWEWDGANWAQVNSGGPAPRSHGAMVYQAALGSCVLHGGTDGSQTFGDTWLWNGTVWTQPPTPVAPAARTDHALAYDSRTGLVYLFGGALPGPVATNDLWRWDGGQWTLLAANAPPAPRAFHDFTFDPDRSRFVLHGSDTSNDTWEWDGANQWTQIAGGDAAGTATAGGVAWDSVQRRVLLWDGGQLWAFGARAAAVQTYGSGCGAVIPDLVAGGRPLLGSSSFGLEIAHASAGALVGLVGSLTAANTPLPGGCTALLQNPVTFGLALADGTGLARFGVAVPPVAAFHGLTFFNQAAVFDPISGLALTAGVHSTVGD
jgi:hypothetical protein